MNAIKLYDTVELLVPIGKFQPGILGAVVEIYTTPDLAYDIEIVTDEGKTDGLLEAVQPQQIQLARPSVPEIRLASVTIEGDGARAAVHFSDGTEVVVNATELYALAN